jgi:hypothetical protein
LLGNRQQDMHGSIASQSTPAQRFTTTSAASNAVANARLNPINNITMSTSSPLIAKYMNLNHANGDAPRVNPDPSSVVSVSNSYGAQSTPTPCTVTKLTNMNTILNPDGYLSAKLNVRLALLSFVSAKTSLSKAKELSGLISHRLSKRKSVTPCKVISKKFRG